MLQRHLKKIANESIFNPNKPDTLERKVLLDVNNSVYWIIRASEHINTARHIVEGSAEWHEHLRQAIELLILARTKECSF